MDIAISDSLKVWSQFIHPVVMWLLLAITIYVLYLGIKVRQGRTATGETKKEIIKGRYNIKHYQIASLLLAFLTVNAFLAMAVTYINTGKIFFGSHLIAGLVVVNLVVISASLSPFMQRGNIWARNLHLALGICISLLFGWQAFTGTQVVQNLINKM